MPTKDDANGQPGIRAVNRAASIVSALAEHPFPLGVAELASCVNLSAPSVYRMLRTLVQLGWVDQNTRTSKYRLGTRLMGIGSMSLIVNPLVQNAKPRLSRIVGLTGLDAVLSTLVGARVVHLARVQGTRTGMSDFEPGISHPAHAMADGKLLLAHLNENERSFLYQSVEFRKFTDRTIVDPTELEEEFTKIRSQGFSVDNFERHEHARGVAVPILGSDERPVLAMLLIGQQKPDEIDVAALKDEMLLVAREIANDLILMGDMPRPSVEFARYNLE